MEFYSKDLTIFKNLKSCFYFIPMYSYQYFKKKILFTYTVNLITYYHVLASTFVNLTLVD